MASPMRDLRLLPKANLHLHLTGSMRPSTAAELAARYGVELPGVLDQGRVYGWWAFQARYDAAREAVRSAADIARVIREAVADDAADGAGWTEIQVDPTSYADRLGGLEAVLEAVLDAAAGLPVGVLVAAGWHASPAHAERLARLAATYAPWGVVGFGLSNDERRGQVRDFERAFRIAADAGLLAAPHAGFYEDASHVRDCVTLLGAQRIGHGVTAAADPAVLRLLAERRVTVEICPTSYPPFGVALEGAPIRPFLAAGVPLALATDDPLLFGVGLAGQYVLAREEMGCSDDELAAIARHSIEASAAPEPVRTRLLDGVRAWLEAPADGPSGRP